nr:MAG TPA: hypothetical protein [Caudoviricetes sp.]
MIRQRLEAGINARQMILRHCSQWKGLLGRSKIAPL